MTIFKTVGRAGLLALVTTLVACGGGIDNDNDRSSDNGDTNTNISTNEINYRVTVYNATHNQPLSPIALLLHTADYRAWQIGGSASTGLEELAESGSTDTFLAEATSAMDRQSGSGVVAPGSSAEFTLSAFSPTDLQLTVASMLVNTNDAFSGVTGLEIGRLEVGESDQLFAPVYDAGTESNSETAATVPGPAGGGEGFNEAREVRDQITRHPGVVTQDDGYGASALDESHRFSNGAMVIKVERIL